MIDVVHMYMYRCNMYMYIVLYTLVVVVLSSLDRFLTKLHYMCVDIQCHTFVCMYCFWNLE